MLLLSRAAVIDCFEEEEREIIEQYNKKGRLDYEKIMTYNIQSKDCFHEILYQSVGNPTGKLLCFLADEVRIEGSDRILKKQPVAIIFSALFSGKEYQGLLHMESV